MRLVVDHSAGAAAVYVQCLACKAMVRLSDAQIDSDGPAFLAYYHRGCVAVLATLAGPCDKWDCARPECSKAPRAV